MQATVSHLCAVRVVGASTVGLLRGGQSHGEAPHESSNSNTLILKITRVVKDMRQSDWIERIRIYIERTSKIMKG